MTKVSGSYYFETPAKTFIKYDNETKKWLVTITAVTRNETEIEVYCDKIAVAMLTQFGNFGTVIVQGQPKEKYVVVVSNTQTRTKVNPKEEVITCKEVIIGTKDQMLTYFLVRIDMYTKEYPDAVLYGKDLEIVQDARMKFGEDYSLNLLLELLNIAGRLIPEEEFQTTQGKKD